MADIVYSVNQVPIRLTDERWRHIVENHDDMAGFYFDVMETVADPEWIFQGNEDELWAVKLITERKAILVVYKENQHENNGFIITAFFTTKINRLLKRRIIWQKK